MNKILDINRTYSKAKEITHHMNPEISNEKGSKPVSPEGPFYTLTQFRNVLGLYPAKK